MHKPSAYTQGTTTMPSQPVHVSDVIRTPAASLGDAQTRLRRIKRLAWLMDGAFRLPGTGFRFGLNGLIGLVPVGGDAALGLLSLYILHEASKMGVPRDKLLRMAGNIVLEVAGGAIPVVGDLFDMALKANLRNIAIIEEHVRTLAQTA
jgi:hypothetical protein